jgi:hypothetical protein
MSAVFLTVTLGVFVLSLSRCSLNPTVENFRAIDRALASLPMGNIAFDVPRMMQVDEGYSVHVGVSGSRSVTELEQELQQRLQAQDPYLEGAQIKIAPEMQAVLQGNGFHISALMPEIQPVGMKSETQWQWEVTPNRGGNLTLHLTLNALLKINGQSTQSAIRTFDRTIAVQVTWKRRTGDFFRDNYKWIWTVAVIPFATWLRQKRRRKESKIGFRPPN